MKWPERRCGHTAATCVSGPLLVTMGGAKSSKTMTNDCWIYDFITMLWKKVLVIEICNSWLYTLRCSCTGITSGCSHVATRCKNALIHICTSVPRLIRSASTLWIPTISIDFCRQKSIILHPVIIPVCDRLQVKFCQELFEYWIAMSLIKYSLV